MSETISLLTTQISYPVNKIFIPAPRHWLNYYEIIIKRSFSVNVCLNLLPLSSMDKKEQILEAAEELFAQKGFEGTSVRELGKKAGINIAMISYYFGSKEKLFEALVEHRSSFIRERLQLLSRDEKRDPMSKIEMMIDFYVDRIVSHNRFSRILHRELSLQQRSEMHNAIADILLRNLQEIRKIIQEGVRKKIFKASDP